MAATSSMLLPVPKGPCTTHSGHALCTAVVQPVTVFSGNALHTHPSFVCRSWSNVYSRVFAGTQKSSSLDFLPNLNDSRCYHSTGRGSLSGRWSLMQHWHRCSTCEAPGTAQVSMALSAAACSALRPKRCMMMSASTTSAGAACWLIFASELCVPVWRLSGSTKSLSLSKAVCEGLTRAALQR